MRGAAPAAPFLFPPVWAAVGPIDRVDGQSRMEYDRKDRNKMVAGPVPGYDGVGGRLAAKEATGVRETRFNRRPEQRAGAALVPLFSVVLAALLALAALAGWRRTPAVPPSTPEAAVLAPAPLATLTLAAVGDIMCHLPQVRAAWDAERKVYDFSPAFAAVAPHLRAADLTVANLETVLDDARPYRGYPRFNSPAALAQALSGAGVDIVTTANNHALDQGEAGVLATLRNLKAAGLLSTGTFAGAADRGPLLHTLKGFKLAFLAYTLSTNGLKPPAGKEYLVNTWDWEQAAKDIAAARAGGAEFVVVSMHWGQEYQRRPTAEQEELARKLAGAGADLILGSHPHVLQPLAEIIRPGGDERVLAAYSLGNFISNQRDPHTDRGQILYVTLTRDPLNHRVLISSYRVLPTRVLRGRVIRVVPAALVDE